MKKYRLKKEAVPFFADKLATAICEMDVWENIHVDDKALEEVEAAHIEYGIKSSECIGSLSGWSADDGGLFHFTLVLPPMNYKDYDELNKRKMIRELMNRIQDEANRFLDDFSTGKNQ